MVGLRSGSGAACDAGGDTAGIGDCSDERGRVARGSQGESGGGDSTNLDVGAREHEAQQAEGADRFELTWQRGRLRWQGTVVVKSM